MGVSFELARQCDSLNKGGDDSSASIPASSSGSAVERVDIVCMRPRSGRPSKEGSHADVSSASHA